MSTYDTVNSDVSDTPMSRRFLTKAFAVCRMECTWPLWLELHVGFVAPSSRDKLLTLLNSYQWMSRKEIRARYGLKGDAAEDAVWTVCCPVCALVQEEKEVLKHATQLAIPRQDTGYVPQDNMRM